MTAAAAVAAAERELGWWIWMWMPRRWRHGDRIQNEIPLVHDSSVARYSSRRASHSCMCITRNASDAKLKSSGGYTTTPIIPPKWWWFYSQRKCIATFSSNRKYQNSIEIFEIFRWNIQRIEKIKH